MVVVMKSDSSKSQLLFSRKPAFLGSKGILGHESTWEIEVKKLIYRKCSPLSNSPWSN